MTTEQTPDAIDARFFAALLGADTETLASVLTDDFLIVDVFTGSVAPKPVLLDAIGQAALRFTAIDVVERSIRTYADAAIVVGQTQMAGEFGGAPFEVHSRYTHVYVRSHGTWQMAAAQGTRIGASQ